MPHGAILCRALRRCLAGAALAAALSVTPVAHAADGGVSVAVHTSGNAREGQRVSYAIEVRNATDHALPEAVVTQQLPADLAFVAATPTARRDGRHLSWTLDLPAHGVARITMTGAAEHPHHQSLVHSGRHSHLTTTVCVRGDDGVLACATGSSALRSGGAPRWRRSAAAVA
ncbi:MAG: DUF11 domain-containing protein, partial [Catenulispora sp.]|nr:DUF11 domain-containing protein [Catenulispora sp.]